MSAYIYVAVHSRGLFREYLQVCSYIHTPSNCKAALSSPTLLPGSYLALGWTHSPARTSVIAYHNHTSTPLKDQRRPLSLSAAKSNMHVCALSLWRHRGEVKSKTSERNSRLHRKEAWFSIRPLRCEVGKSSIMECRFGYLMAFSGTAAMFLARACAGGGEGSRICFLEDDRLLCILLSVAFYSKNRSGFCSAILSICSSSRLLTIFTCF